jgi:Bacterial TSP3 repeat
VEKTAIKPFRSTSLVCWLAAASLLTPLVVRAQTNSWINTLGGSWQTSSDWSLGVPPTNTQSAILITNDTTKTVAINTKTSPDLLTVSNLTVGAPGGSTNTLAMTNTGTNAPLHILNLLTIADGGVVSMTNSVLQADGPLGIDGLLVLRPGAQIVATNAFTSVGSAFATTGQVTIASGVATFRRLIVGSNLVSSGTFTMTGGSLVVSNMAVALGSNALGAAWILDSTFSSTASVVVANSRNAVGQLAFSNSTARLRDLLMAISVGSRGTLTIAGSTVTFFGPGGLSGGLNSTSSVFVTDGQLIMTNGPLVIGSIGCVGQMMVSNASILAASLTTACCDNSKGTFTAVSSSLSFSDSVAVCSGNSSTGALWLADSQLQLTAPTNGILISLGGGVGQVVLSNNSAVAANTLWLGLGGTLTVQGGTMCLASNFFMADSSSSTAGMTWVTGGQVLVSNGVMTLGQLTISNGFVSVWDATVASTTASSCCSEVASHGLLSVEGGSFSASSSLILGKCATNALGQIVINGGKILVTNATHTGYLDLRGGTLTINGGSVVVDRIIMTNACAQIVRTGGTLIAGTLMLDPALDADGDGLPNGWEQTHGLDPLSPNGNDGASGDPDGDGLSNAQEFALGTDPMDKSSPFHITGVSLEGDNVRVTWLSVGGETNVVEAATDLSGVYSNISPNILLPGLSLITTNYLDPGSATNVPSRFYRIRLVP